MQRAIFGALALVFSGCALSTNTSTERETFSHEDALRALLSGPTYEVVFHRVFSDTARTAGQSGAVLFSADVDVKIGVDAGRVRLQRVGDADAVVTMPAAHVMSANIVDRPIHRFYVAFPNSWLIGTNGTHEDTVEVERELPLIESEVTADGGMNRAETNAQSMMSAYLHKAGYANVTFVVTATPGQKVRK